MSETIQYSHGNHYTLKLKMGCTNQELQQSQGRLGNFKDLGNCQLRMFKNGSLQESRVPIRVIAMSYLTAWFVA